jgi:2-oxoglutarate dehydrogenase E1 component
MHFKNSGFDANNLTLIEELYEKYKNDPSQVAPAWKQYFENLGQVSTSSSDVKEAVHAIAPINQPEDIKVYNLIVAYRTYGHLMAKINPISTTELKEPWQLKIESYGFNEADLKKEYPTCGILKKKRATLEEILNALKETYSNRIGLEYMNSISPDMEAWIQQKIEPIQFNFALTIDQKHTILQHLNKSELFEVFLHTKYPGQKRFSLEGGETLIPIIEGIIETAAGLDSEEFVIGMAHRGRLNVLSNILQKSHVQIFSEFDENYIPESFEGSGDVKYHKGFYSESLSVNDHKIHIALTPNPSHLEAVDPVVEGQCKAKQIAKNSVDSQGKVVPILVHGDAALAGQGIVYETLQLSKLQGYATGGTIHIVINNQIGFTTLPEDARSTFYCTDIAKTFGAPVFHVNAEDPEGCFNAAILAMELRQKFHCDVFIDLNCYRKYGHNETDEPSFTQPHEYKLIREKQSIREIYRDNLINQGFLEKKLAEDLEQEFRKNLQEALSETKQKITDKKVAEDSLPGKKIENPFQFVDTAVSLQILEEVGQKACSIPNEFTVHPKLESLLKDRQNMAKQGPGSKPLDWGMAEILAYGTLLVEKRNIRLTGQDVGRGTFSHRHALWVDQKQEKKYFSLQHLQKEQGRFDLINSLLSEYAALGFEFGYSIANTNTLVIWEAQFGDFSNGAQVIIDQFISTAEQKWSQKSNITLLLPHGYEGQGPEHSSARMERFLTLAGNNNMFIVNPTTPAQLFHLLRRQMLKSLTKPLIVFTPKGLLRHPECVSPLVDLSTGSFQEVIDDPKFPKTAERLVFCSGRIYYDLSAMREKTKTDDLAIIRIEQLYPLHEDKISALLRQYSSAKKIYWVQEEPKNMGAWNFIAPLINELLPNETHIEYVGRNPSASPAAGSYALHKKEHAAIMDALFTRKPSIFELAGDSKKK